jgi:hypothetical protein
LDKEAVVYFFPHKLVEVVILAQAREDRRGGRTPSVKEEHYRRYHGLRYQGYACRFKVILANVGPVFWIKFKRLPRTQGVTLPPAFPGQFRVF